MKINYSFPIARWDEGIPLGNGLLGAIVWGDTREIVLSLDQATLWDERIPESYNRKDWNFVEMLRMIREKKWAALSEKFESPGNDPWPTKLRACRLILRLPKNDAWTKAELDISTGEAVIFSRKGQVAVVCDASRPLLALRAVGAKPTFRLDYPNYEGPPGGGGSAKSLCALGYPAALHGSRKGARFCVQPVTGGQATVTATNWRQGRDNMEIYTCVTGLGDPELMTTEACGLVEACAEKGYAGIKRESSRWWREFWSKSQVQISHKNINQHYQLGQYFLGSSSRTGTPPMPLQGVWTADDGNLPPWRGDFHHNLNTQFSYISYLSNNRIDEGLVFLEHMWTILPKHRELAAHFFKAPGAFIPCAMSLAGELISGWAPYCFSLTNGAWVADMFHRHWKYTLDETFLRDRAYPYCLAQGEFLLHHLKPDPATGRLLLPMSTSAEIYDNTPRSYLPSNTNYDHFLMLKLFKDLEEMSAALGQKKESAKWKRHAKSLGGPALARIPSPDGLIHGDVLGLAPGLPLDRSHRHHAHLMGVYPLNLLHPVNGAREKDLIADSLHQIDLLGTGEWVGYSFSWYAGLCARIGNGGAAISMLERYLDGFVSPNGFHLNGDFKNLGYSVYKYRPFTLEGNFAAVQAVNEMLLQCINGVVHVGYSLPVGISASFSQLRTEGAFLVSASIDKNGVISRFEITSIAGGLCRIANPWPSQSVCIKSSQNQKKDGDIIEFETVAGANYRLAPQGIPQRTGTTFRNQLNQ
jgi:alpha-L-fucosidase 2